MRVGILNIGDELLGGKILNSNQFDLARMLCPLGHEIPFNLVIGDEEAALARALDWALGPGFGNARAMPAAAKPVDMLILTGGLGPTRDDVTRQAVAGFLGRPLRESPEAMEWLCAFLGKPSAEMPWGQRVQASVPEGTRPLRNPAGTACGIAFEARGVPAFAFPGVPAELDAMMRLHVLPGLKGDGVLLEKSAWTWGWSESAQRRAFASLAVPDAFRFSSLPGEKGVRITLSVLCAPSDRDRRAAELDALWLGMLDAMPPEAIVDRGGAALPQAVMNLLLARGATVSVAESCTGGGLGFLLTETPGSSEVFQKGFLTYSNRAKTELLGVDPLLLKTFGAVSEETALAMARGCLERSGATYA
ncbi:MAG TPA: nicotinamide-nucleotide amidohydrolase family protein, partial [Fibrobacteria bacterium]|nr:nicotinamide-nucleotide amidohydrolase family protein [Fibrobacteria bacterium]